MNATVVALETVLLLPPAVLILLCSILGMECAHLIARCQIQNIIQNIFAHLADVFFTNSHIHICNNQNCSLVEKGLVLAME